MSKLGQSHAGPLDMLGKQGPNQPQSFGGAQGAVMQPSVAPMQGQSLADAMNNGNPLDNSMRGSNILSTPSSKAGRDEEEDKQ